MRGKSASSDESGELNDSIWAVVAGAAKAYNLPFDYVLYDLSYSNMVLYEAVIPQYNPKDKDGKKPPQEEVKADDPKNRNRVKSIIDSFD